MYIKRDLEELIFKYLNSKEIIAILGPRQVGKTTLMKNIFKRIKGSKKFLDFEDPEIVQLFDEDIKSFSKLHIEGNDFVFIDEFQYSLKGGKNLKFIYDTCNVKLIVSGSSSPDITFKLLSALVGRIFIMELYPLSIKEILTHYSKKEYFIANDYILNGKEIPEPIHNNLIKVTKDFIVFGGYPRVVISETEEEKKDVLRNLVITHLMREIRGFFRISKEYSFNKLLNSLSLQSGNLIVYSELSNQSGLNLKEVKEYIRILEETYIVRMVKPYYTNKRTEVVKTPKVYFIDNGFRNYLTKNFNDFSHRADRGAITENFVFSEILKGNLQEIKYWRAKSKGEVDFIIESEKIVPVEVKSGVTNSFGKSFLSFIEKYKPPFGIIINSGNFRLAIKNKTKIYFLPFYVNIGDFIKNNLF